MSMDTPLTSADLDAMEARAKKATPGPWIATPRETGNSDGWANGWDVDGPPIARRAQFIWGNDARFVAAARQDVPALLAEVRRLRAALEGLVRFEGEFVDGLGHIECFYCPAIKTLGGNMLVDHAPNCPYIVGRRVLGDSQT